MVLAQLSAVAKGGNFSRGSPFKDAINHVLAVINRAVLENVQFSSIVFSCMSFIITFITPLFNKKEKKESFFKI